MSFADLMLEISPLIAANRLTMDGVVEACNSIGMPSLPVAAARLDLLPSLHAAILARVAP